MASEADTLITFLAQCGGSSALLPQPGQPVCDMGWNLFPSTQIASCPWLPLFLKRDKALESTN